MLPVGGQEIVVINIKSPSVSVVYKINNTFILIASYSYHLTNLHVFLLIPTSTASSLERLNSSGSLEKTSEDANFGAH